jgi:branched-chain amino acid transport system ATP-binding protein
LSEAPAPLLDVRGVVRHYRGVPALDGATLDVREGSITSLIGPNGAGKTTLFNVVSGLARPEAGTVAFAGREITGRAPWAIAARGLVRTFQTPRVLRRMTVLDNVRLAAPEQPGERLWRLFATPGRVRRREREVDEQARRMLETVGLERMADAYAGTLSGGQRKLLEFARALMREPRLVLLDEPMAGVNPTLGRRLLDWMHRLNEDEGLTFLLIEHDLEVVMSASERVIVMNAGRVIADGPPAAIQRDDRVIDAYLGARRQPAAPPA